LVWRHHLRLQEIRDTTIATFLAVAGSHQHLPAPFSRLRRPPLLPLAVRGGWFWALDWER
jgi:hypothetical protein